MKPYSRKERPKKGDVVVTGGIPHRKVYSEAFEVVEVLLETVLKVVPHTNSFVSPSEKKLLSDAESFLDPSDVHLVMRTDDGPQYIGDIKELDQ